MLLLTKTHPEIERLRGIHGEGIGRLIVPRQRSSIEETASAGVPWALDNGAFAGFDETAFLFTLDRACELPGCLFVAAPDVVGDAAATLALFDDWADAIRSRGLPPALVAQDGLAPADVPWTEIGALFIGGTDDYKLGPGGAAVAREAERRGVWLHIGRVNSMRRARYARSLGASSIDGSGYARFCNTYPHHITQLLSEPRHLLLEEAS